MIGWMDGWMDGYGWMDAKKFMYILEEDISGTVVCGCVGARQKSLWMHKGTTLALTVH